MSVIKIEDLSKVYRLYNKPIDRLKEALNPFGKSYHRDFFALKNVSFTVEPGKSVGIIGLNGSGKSTILQIIAGVLSPTKGTVTTHGKIAALLELGAGLNPEFSGIENIRFQTSILGMTSREVDTIMPSIAEFADIGPFIHQPVKTYSSGMFVRLAFAISINVDPDILIVDEALAVGDIRFQAKCLNKIREFKKLNKTLLFVSHDPGAVKALCDETHLLHKGELICSGKPDKVFNTYNSMLAMDADQIQEHRGSTVNISERSGNQRARIEGIELLNEEGQPVDTFTSGSRIKIRVLTRIYADIEDLTVGILIRDRFGNDVFGINNYLLGQEISRVRAGETLITEYTLPLNLGENLYKLTVAAHSGDNHVAENYDWINDAYVFRVVHTRDYRFSGVVRIEPDLTVQRH